jgi:hypothetical protein
MPSPETGKKTRSTGEKHQGTPTVKQKNAFDVFPDSKVMPKRLNRLRVVRKIGFKGFHEDE